MKHAGHMIGTNYVASHEVRLILLKLYIGTAIAWYLL